MTSNGSPEEKLRLMFRMYDKDGNGSIDAREMNEWVAGWAEELEPQKIPNEPCFIGHEYCCIVSLKQPPRVIRECYQMLGEDSHGKAEDMFNMMDKWVLKNDCSTFFLYTILFSGMGTGRSQSKSSSALVSKMSNSPAFFLFGPSQWLIVKGCLEISQKETVEEENPTLASFLYSFSK